MLVVGGTGAGPHGGLVYVWRPATPDQPADRFRTPRTMEELDFTPDGSQVVLSTGWADGGYFMLWDTAAQRTVKTVHADAAGVLTADVSTDGRTLMTGGQTGAVRLWDLATGKPLTGLSGLVDTADRAPDGSTAVGADEAGDVLLWDVRTRSAIGDAVPGPVAGRNAAASFTPDGRSVVVISDTGAGWVWDVNPSHWLARACQVAGRSLTRQEWQELLPTGRTMRPAVPDRPSDRSRSAVVSHAIRSMPEGPSSTERANVPPGKEGWSCLRRGPVPGDVPG